MLKEILNIAKEAQKRLEKISAPAEHIFVIENKTQKTKTFLFVSRLYDKFNIYDLAEISSYIQTNNGPLSNKFFVLGEEHIAYGTFGIKVSDLYLATKIYGKKELDIEDKTNEDSVHGSAE